MDNQISKKDMGALSYHNISRILAKRPDTLWYRINRWIVQTYLGSKISSWIAHYTDAYIYRITNGKMTLSSWLTGLPIMILTTTGAKTGVLRDTPLLGLSDGYRVILVGTNFGRKHHPGWFYNIKTNPAVSIAVGGERWNYQVYEAVGEEREKYWQAAVSVYGGYATYRHWASPREIPVLVCEPIVGA